MGVTGWLHVILLLAIGVLALSAQIQRKKPETKEWLDRLTKFSGLIGTIALLWGLFVLIKFVLLETEMISMGAPIFLLWLSSLVTAVVEICLGLLFGYGFLSEVVFMLLHKKAKGLSEGIRQKLLAFQVPLGWAALCTVIWWPVFTYVLLRIWFRF